MVVLMSRPAATAMLSCAVILVSFSCPASAAKVRKAELAPLLRRHAHTAQLKLTATASAEKTAPALRATVAEEMAPTEPPSIPEPADVGSNGFPTLPGLQQMVGGAGEMIKTINSQAKTLEARVVQAQITNQAKMARQKASYEQKLKSQEESNRMVIYQNKQVQTDIHTLKSNNDALRKHSHELEDSNRVMRKELKTLQTKLSLAQSFVAESLSKTDDSKAKELEVLQKGNSRVHRGHHVYEDGEEGNSGGNDAGASAGEEADDDADESDDSDGKADKDDDDDDDSTTDEGTSFLALKVKRFEGIDDGEAAPSSDDQLSQFSQFESQAPQISLFNPPPVSNPHGLLDVLSQGVASLEKEEKESEKRLRSMFVTDFTVGNKRHEALIAQQKALNSTRYTLLGLRTDLRKAESRLDDTRGHLEQRLRGFGLFAQKLAHLALAPAAEAPRLLEAFPAGVTIPPPSRKLTSDQVNNS